LPLFGGADARAGVKEPGAPASCGDPSAAWMWWARCNLGSTLSAKTTWCANQNYVAHRGCYALYVDQGAEESEFDL